MEQNPCWKANQFSANQEFLIFLESEVALPNLQVPANYSYPSRINQIHATPSKFPMINLNITLPSTPGAWKCSLSLRFTQKPCMKLSPPPNVIHAHLISFFSI
jgi:hypothetical protein